MYTTLKAINLMLSAVGERPIETLEAGFGEAEIAQQILDEVLEEVQAHDWSFNSETGLKLLPDENGFVFLPSNVLRVDSIRNDDQLVQRGNRLYNKKTHSYSIGKVVEVDIKVKLQIEELPYSAAHYIAVRAARVFQSRSLNSNTLDATLEKEEARAYALLLTHDLDEGDYNILNEGLAHYTTRRVR